MLSPRSFTNLIYFASIIFSASFFLIINLRASGGSNLAPLSANQLIPEGVSITRSLIESAMPELKQSKLGKILTRYYNYCLGGAENWDAIYSIKVSAELRTADVIQV